MLGIKGLKLSQIKAISSASVKLQLDKSKLDALLAARKAGLDDERVIAELLGVPEGVEAKDYIRERVTEKEYEALRSIVAQYTNGKGKNPLD